MLKKFFREPINILACYSIRENLNTTEKLIIQNQYSISNDDVFDIFQKNELSSIAYKNIRPYLPVSEQEKWKVSYEAVQSRIKAMFDELTVLGKFFAEKSIKVVALKNGGLAQVCGNDYAEHPMGDIDLFVSKGEFYEAHAVIISQGFTFEFRSDFEEEDLEKAFSDGSTEYFKVLDNGNKMWLELSWRSVSGRWINRDKEPNAEALMKDTIKGDIPGISLLSPEDNLLQVSIHTAKHSYFRAPGFRLHLDVKRVTSYFDIDWTIFLEKVNKANTKTAVYFSLYLSKKFLNADVPEFVLDNLKPILLKRALINFCFRNFSLNERFYFKKHEFILFQISLYDSFSDVLQVAFPPKDIIKIKYEKRFLLTGYFTHLLDLIGIRRKFKK